MHLGAVNVHIELQFCADGFNVFETFLIIRSSTSNPDLDFMFNQSGCIFSERTDDALER